MRQSFSIGADGFYGVLESDKSRDFVVILYVDDDPNSMIGKGAVRWFAAQHINVLAMSPQPKNTGLRNVSVDHIENAVHYLKRQGFVRIGIMGLSSTAMIALTAASLIAEITLTIAATPCDFVMEGTLQDGLDGAKERPADGESSLMYHGRPLPYEPFPYRHPEYWNQMVAEGKRRGDKLAAFDTFEEAEKRHPVGEDAFIKVENIHGRLLLIGAQDDAMWNTSKYIRRMSARLSSRPHFCTCETMIFEHGTHYVFPEGVIRKILPFGVDFLLPRLFSEAKGHTAECRQTRLAIEKRVLECCRAKG